MKQHLPKLSVPGKKSNLLRLAAVAVLFAFSVTGSAQIISTVAGNYTSGPGYAGDGSAAAAIGVQLGYPVGVAIDASGNLYIADKFNNVIRKVTAATGIISTVAGHTPGTSGYSGDGSAATGSGVKLNFPTGVAIDASGNLYIADDYNNVIRKVTAATGIISTVAGNHFAGFTYAGDGGAATAAGLYYPAGVALDASGNLYIADNGNSVIRKVTAATGIISTVAGNNASGHGYAGDGSAATASGVELYGPSGVAIDASGNLYIADYRNNVIRKVTVATGIISTVAGNYASGAGYAGDGSAATASVVQLTGPAGVAIDAFGNLYIADEFNNVIRRVDHTTDFISTYAGNNAYGGNYDGDGSAATASNVSLNNPVSIAFDASGNMYFSDQTNSVIRKVSMPSGTTVTKFYTYTGSGSTTDATLTANWTNDPTGATESGYYSSPVNFTTSADTFVMTASMTTSGAWTVSGYVEIGTTVSGVTFAPVNTVTIGGALTMGNNGTFDPNSGETLNLAGNLTVGGTATFNVASTGSNIVHFNGTSNVYWPSTAQGYQTELVVDASHSAKLLSNLPLTDPYGNYSIGVLVNGTLDFGTYAITCASSHYSHAGFTLNSGATLTTANTNSSGAIYGSLGTLPGSISLSGGANYIFDGTSAQHTGTGSAGLPASISSGSVTINNTASSGVGVTLDQTTTVDVLNFNTGILKIGSNNVTLSSYTGTPSASEMIEADGSGQVIASYASSTPGTFTYPIGYFSSGYYYSPATVIVNSVTSSGAYTVGVNLNPTEESHNFDADNYIGLFWSVAVSGTSAVNYDVTASYPSGVYHQLTGTPHMYMGEWNGSAWTLFTAANTGAQSITTTGFSGVTAASADFTGISNQASVSVSPVAYCSASTGTLTATPTDDASTCTGGITYTWSPTTALSASTGSSVTVSQSTPGTYTYSVTMTDCNGFTATNGVVVTVNPTPTVNTITNTTYCSGASASAINFVDPGNTGATFAWVSTYDIGFGTTRGTSNIAAFTASAASVTVATITATPAANSCTGSATVVTTITVNPTPSSVSVGTTGSYCSSTTITATGGSGGTIYYEGTTSSGVSTATPETAQLITTTGTYYFNAASAAGCWGTQGSVAITINPQPAAITGFPGGGIISTVAGNGSLGYGSDGVAATATDLNQPFGVAVDGSGNIYIADINNQRIRKVNISGIISTVAGNGAAGFGAGSGDGGAATATDLKQPIAVALDGSGNIYIADQLNSRIRKVNTSGIISTVAGNGSFGYGVDGVAATATDLNAPTGVAVDGSGNIYIADQGNSRIRMVNTSGIISTVAGNGGSGYGSDGIAATATDLSDPYGVAVDGSGNIYIADQGNNRIRMVNTSGIISTVAGNRSGGYGSDGVAATATDLYNPSGVAVDGSGNIYIADVSNSRIRKVNISGIISTVAGNGTAGSGTDGVAATTTEINSPYGVAVDGSGAIYIADISTSSIRKVSGGPSSGTVCTGATLVLSDATGGGTWSSSSSNATVVSGTVTGATAGMATISYTITGGCYSTGSVTVNATPTVNTITNATYCNSVSESAINFVDPANTATTFAWVSTNDIGFGTTNGTGSIAAYSTSNSGSTTLSAAITVTPTVLGCIGSPTLVTTISVNPTPTVNAIGSQVICSGDIAAMVTPSGTATIYNWTNDQSAVDGLAASGSNSSLTFSTSSNSGSSPVIGNFVVTPVYVNSVTCTGITTSFTVTVNPTPTVNAIGSQVICSGDIAATVTPSGVATTYNWTNDQSAIDGLAGSGTNTSLVFSSSSNTGSSPVIGTIAVTPVYVNSITCTGASPTSFTVTVNPTPTINSIGSQILCSGATAATVTPSGVATTYNWTNDQSAVDGLAASGSNTSLTFSASSNTGSSPVIGNFVVTPVYVNSITCTGASPTGFTVTVNPAPTVTISGGANQAVCNTSSTAAITFTGVATAFNWTNDNTAINLGSSGVGNISAFTATNGGATTIGGNIAVTAVYVNSITCTGNTANTTLSVNPSPTSTGATISLTPICLTGTVTLSANTTNANTWVWTGSDGSGYSGATPVVTPTVTGTIVYSLSASNAATGCAALTVYTTSLYVLPSTPGPSVANLGVGGVYSAIGYTTVIKVASETIPPSTYLIKYNLSGANIVAGATASMTFTGGMGQFITPVLANGGTTGVTLISIQDETSSCLTNITKYNSASFSVHAMGY